MSAKTEKTADFSPSNEVGDGRVSSGGQDQGSKYGGWETAANVTTANEINNRWNKGLDSKRKEFVDGKDYN